jgi:hypothetical protein
MAQTLKENDISETLKNNLDIFQPKLLKLKTMNKIDMQSDLDKAYWHEKQKFVQKMKDIDEMKRQAQPTHEEKYQSGK